MVFTHWSQHQLRRPLTFCSSSTMTPYLTTRSERTPQSDTLFLAHLLNLFQTSMPNCRVLVCTAWMTRTTPICSGYWNLSEPMIDGSGTFLNSNTIVQVCGGIRPCSLATILHKVSYSLLISFPVPGIPGGHCLEHTCFPHQGGNPIPCVRRYSVVQW